MRNIVTSCLLLLLFVLGCSEKASDTTFIVVNGEAVTESAVREAVLVQARIRELAGSPVAPEKFNDWANARAQRLMGTMPNSILVRQDADSRGIKVEPVDIEKTLSSFNAQTHQKCASVDELAAKFGDLEGAFRRQFEETAKATAYERACWTVPVSDKMVAQHFKLLTNALEQAKSIDAAARTKAESAYRRLKAGERWEKVAAVSEDRLINAVNEKFATEWLTVGADAMGMKQLAAQLPSMKPGDYTRPMDTQFGMIIVRLNAKKGSIFRLSRILFRMAKPVRIESTVEEGRTTVAQQLRQAEMEKTLARLQGQAAFEYPMGTNFTYQIWKTEK